MVKYLVVFSGGCEFRKVFLHKVAFQLDIGGWCETAWGPRSMLRYGFTFYSPGYEYFISTFFFLVGHDLKVSKITCYLETKTFGQKKEQRSEANERSRRVEARFWTRVS